MFTSINRLSQDIFLARPQSELRQCNSQQHVNKLQNSGFIQVFKLRIVIYG